MINRICDIIGVSYVVGLPLTILIHGLLYAK